MITGILNRLLLVTQTVTRGRAPCAEAAWSPPLESFVEVEWYKIFKAAKYSYSPNSFMKYFMKIEIQPFTAVIMMLSILIDNF
jgi:hypothetical protein